KKFTDAATALDKPSAGNYNMMSTSAGISLQRAYGDRAARATNVQDYDNFLGRTENIIQQAYQNTAQERAYAMESAPPAGAEAGHGAVASMRQRSSDFTEVWQGKKDEDQTGHGAAASAQLVHSDPKAVFQPVKAEVGVTGAAGGAQLLSSD